MRESMSTSEGNWMMLSEAITELNATSSGTLLGTISFHHVLSVSLPRSLLQRSKYHTRYY